MTLKDGKQHFLWHRHKTINILKNHIKKASLVDQKVREHTSGYKQALRYLDEGQDKMGYMFMDYLYEELSDDIQDQALNKLKETCE